MRYIRPLSIEDAVGLLAGSVGTAAILAGGSDLLGLVANNYVEIYHPVDKVTPWPGTTPAWCDGAVRTTGGNALSE